MISNRETNPLIGKTVVFLDFFKMVIIGLLFCGKKLQGYMKNYTILQYITRKWFLMWWQRVSQWPLLLPPPLWIFSRFPTSTWKKIIKKRFNVDNKLLILMHKSISWDINIKWWQSFSLKLQQNWILQYGLKNLIIHKLRINIFKS